MVVGCWLVGWLLLFLFNYASILCFEGTIGYLMLTDSDRFSSLQVICSSGYAHVGLGRIEKSGSHCEDVEQGKRKGEDLTDLGELFDMPLLSFIAPMHWSS